MVGHTADTSVDTSIGQLKCSHCLNPKPPTWHLPQCLTTVIFKFLIRCKSASPKTAHLETNEWFMALAAAQRISQQSTFRAAQSGLQMEQRWESRPNEAVYFLLLCRIHMTFPVCCVCCPHNSLHLIPPLTLTNIFHLCTWKDGDQELFQSRLIMRIKYKILHKTHNSNYQLPNGFCLRKLPK